MFDRRIAAPEEQLAGCVDFVGKLPDGTFTIMDWKTSKALRERLTDNYGKKAKYVTPMFSLSLSLPLVHSSI